MSNIAAGDRTIDDLFNSVMSFERMYFKGTVQLEESSDCLAGKSKLLRSQKEYSTFLQCSVSDSAKLFVYCRCIYADILDQSRHKYDIPINP
jgi:hypothetical protein